MDTVNVDEIKNLNFKGLREKVEELCSSENLLDPVLLLTGLSNGKDYRKHSLIYHWVIEYLTANGDAPPDEYEWLELVDLIKSEHRYAPVDMNTSKDAQKTLMEYMHPKRKHVENIEVKESFNTSPLSSREIKTFWRKFNIEY